MPDGCVFWLITRWKEQKCLVEDTQLTFMQAQTFEAYNVLLGDKPQLVNKVPGRRKKSEDTASQISDPFFICFGGCLGSLELT